MFSSEKMHSAIKPRPVDWIENGDKLSFPQPLVSENGSFSQNLFVAGS